MTALPVSRLGRSAAILSVLSCGAALAVLWGGCEERDVGFVSDEEEIRNYLAETEDGQEFFGLTGLITEDPYRTPVDTAEWRDSILSHKRTITVSVWPDSLPRIDWGFLGLLREAWVFVRDDFTIQTTRQFPDTSVADTAVRTLDRFGFFLKLGDDFRPYLGWVLYGYNGIGGSDPPVNVWLFPSGAPLFRGDRSVYGARSRGLFTDIPFMLLDDIRNVTAGASIVCSTLTRNSSVPYRTYQLVSAATPTGVVTSAMTRTTADVYRDTVQTPNSNPRLWNLICFQAFDDDTTRFRAMWTAPYRVPQ